MGKFVGCALLIGLVGVRMNDGENSTLTVDQRRLFSGPIILPLTNLTVVDTVFSDPDECLPRSLLFNRGAPFALQEVLPWNELPNFYCTDLQAGGGKSCMNWGESGWASPYVGGACRYHTALSDQRDCQCKTYGCSANAYCYCASKFDSDVESCFKKWTQCGECPPDGINGNRFRQACGCVQCSTLISSDLTFYISNKDVYGFPGKGCQDDRFKASWVCGPGTCVTCPVGAYCDGRRAFKCEPGFFQDRTGQRQCKECIVSAENRYLKIGLDVRNRSVCVPESGWAPGVLVECDECTQFSESTPDLLTANKHPTRRCPPFRADFGTFKIGIRLGGGVIRTCLPCLQCTGREYARPVAEDKYCVTDQSAARCREMYNSAFDTSNYRCEVNAEGRRSCFWTNENVVEGRMPWEPGYRRTLSPHRYKPGAPDDKGLLPYYTACGTSSAADYLSRHYQPLSGYTSRKGNSDQRVRLDAREWALDCDLSTTRQCVTGYYARTSAGTDENGLIILQECVPCFGGTTIEGGFSSRCACYRGGVTLMALSADREFQSGLTALNSIRPRDPQTCVDCFAGIAWRHSSNGRIYQEALACAGEASVDNSDNNNNAPKAVPFRRCIGEREYVVQATSTCGQCAVVGSASSSICTLSDIALARDNADNALQLLPREIPMENRTGCVVCPPGTYIEVVDTLSGAGGGIKVYGCVACPWGSFQPAMGQCACRKKRDSCPPGQQLASSEADAYNVLQDYPCKPCNEGCGPNEITIVSPDAYSPANAIGGSGNATNTTGAVWAPQRQRNTCNGRGGYYFACFDGQGFGTGWAMTAGYRLEYPISESGGDGTVAAGTRARLGQCNPSLLPTYSRFVSQPISAAPGEQCFFSCVYGVQPNMASMYQSELAPYVYASRPDLIPFLPTQGAGGGQAMSSLQAVLVPSMWGYSDTASVNARPSSVVDGRWASSEAWGVRAAQVADLWQNTFLFEDTFTPAFTARRASASPLCLAPRQAYTLSCPRGYTPPIIPDIKAEEDEAERLKIASGQGGAPRAPECALAARTRMYLIAPESGSPVESVRQYAVVSLMQSASAITANAMCLSDAADYARFSIDCGTPCLDRRLANALTVTNGEPAYSTMWRARFSWLSYFLQSQYWYGMHGNFNPYIASDDGCSTTCVHRPKTASSPSSSALFGTLQFAAGEPIMGAINTFRYSTDMHAQESERPTMTLPAGGISACIPCTYGSIDFGETMCRTLFNPPRHFRNDLCMNPPASLFADDVGNELTADMVCAQCAPTASGGAATLIPPSLAGNGAYADWWSVRLSSTRILTFANTIVNGVYPWQAIKCRYRCAETFTSNNLSPKEYEDNPCVPCTDGRAVQCPSHVIAQRIPAYIDVGQGADNNALCGAVGNYAPFSLSCELCADALQQWLPGSGEPMFVFSVEANENPVAARSECMALCNRKFFHSFVIGASGTSPVLAPVPFRLLKCVPCASNLDFPCVDGCADGYYLNNRTALEPSSPACIPCTTAPCAAPLFYREKCFAGAATRDALCVPCPQDQLRNAAISITDDGDDRELRAAIALAANRNSITRRWLSPADLAGSPWAPYVTAVPFSPHPAQCALACINNHVWINRSTGMSPFSAQEGTRVVGASGALFCLPCGSRYIASGGSTYLYSIWNGTNVTEALPAAATAGSVLASVTNAPYGGFPGGCYSCPGYGVRAVFAASRTMCELLPGFTDSYQGVASILQLSVVTMFLGVGGTTDKEVVYAGETLPSVPVFQPINDIDRQQSPDRRRRLLLHWSSAAIPDQNMRRAVAGRGLLSTTTASAEGRMVADPVTSNALYSGNVPGVVVPNTQQWVPAARAPAFSASDHFACCDSDANAQSKTRVENCKLLRGAAYHGLSTAEVRQPCEGRVADRVAVQPLLSAFFGFDGSRRLLQSTGTTDFSVAIEAWMVNRSGVPPSSACYVGTYKPNVGDGPCFSCPLGASTTGPNYAGASDRNECVCLPGFYSVRAENASRTLLRCTPCPKDTYRAPFRNNSDEGDGACVPCPPRMYTVGSGSAYCYCVPGTYPNITFDACVPCEPGFYCDGNVRSRCPDYSFSPSGAITRGECTCDPARFYGDLSLEKGACLPKPPGFVCASNSSGGGPGAIGCGCAEGWITLRTRTNIPTAAGAILTAVQTVRCVSPCTAGQYAQLQPRSQNFKACLACPEDTYAADGTLVGACTPCPDGLGTRGRTGMTSAANCSCVGGTLSVLRNVSGSSIQVATCDGCAMGYYFDLTAQKCAQCPKGWTAPPNTVGLINCLCPAGKYASGAECTPCPLNTFSRAMGLACSPCPKGCITEAVGQTSLAQCKCGRL